MAIFYPGDAELLRAEIAAAAARMIAEDGADYGTAKRKAARLILGNQKVRGDVLPDNAQIEDQVREYQALFFGEFHPWLTGAVLNGTATEHSDIHLQLFADSPKDVAVFLLNAGIDYEVTETPHFRNPNETVETLSFLWKKEGFHLTLYDLDDMRGTSRRQPERADLSTVRSLLDNDD